jgi:hypothetical protein
MKSKMMKRYKEGGPVDDMEVANQSAESQDIARSMGAGERNSDSDTPFMSKSMSAGESAASEKPEYKSFKEAFNAERKLGKKTFDYMGKKYTTDMAARKEVAKPAEPAPKPALRAETNDDRAKRYVEKRAAARAEAAANAARGRSGVKMANGGVVKRATATMRGKAC